jgi:hypothetical protein
MPGVIWPETFHAESKYVEAREPFVLSLLVEENDVTDRNVATESKSEPS